MYRFVQCSFENENIQKYQDLLCKCFPTSDRFTYEYLYWLYVTNPYGKAIGFDAYFNEKLVAHYVTIPLEAKWGSELIKGVLSLNTATAQDHQGKGLFTKLAEMTYNEAEKNGKQFVLGIANKNSTHGFLKKLDFKLISPLKVYLFWGLPAYKEKNTVFKLDWNYLSKEWRLKSPILNSLSDKNDNMFVLPHSIFFKMIINTRPWKNSGIINNNYTLISSWIGLNSNLNWDSTIRFPLPDKLKPSPLNLIFKKLGTFDKNIDINSIEFEAIDFDAY